MKKWYEIQNSANSADVFIYDEIGGWGTNAARFIREVRNLNTKNITLHINSPGGSVFDGITIYNFLKDSDIHVTVKIEGMAASIASIVALSGDKIQMAENSMIMIHNPWAGRYGDADEFRKVAEFLDQVKDILVKTYMSKTNLSKEKIEDMMNEETWLQADEAKELGFIDEIVGEIKIAASIKNEWQDRFSTIPKDFIEKLNNSNAGVSTPEKIKKGEKMDPQILALLNVVAESDAILAIKKLIDDNAIMTADNEFKKEENVRLLAEINKAKVDLAIANKQIAPRQKDFAIKMLAIGEETFDEWLEQNKPELPAGEININNGEDGNALTWETLENDLEKAEALRNSDPATYNKLKENYMEARK